MKSYEQLVRHSGNRSLFDFMDISILGTLCGTPIHLHAEGLRGTGKTTLIRACKEILPKIDRVKGCMYNCNPLSPHCPDHRNLSVEEIREIGIEKIDMPFLEISPSAKKGTVVGSIDLKKLSSKEHPEASLLLGTIPKAHRGIIFMDEINRIADTSPEIADVLLDVMGTKPGRIQIEEAGLSTLEVPVQVSVWAASNPDEDPGPLEDIRRQLSDRFDFSVNVDRPVDPQAIKQILEEGDKGARGILASEKIKKFTFAQKDVECYHPSMETKELLAFVYVNYGLESLRGIEAILLGANIRGALLQRSPDIDDIIFITKYALRHRSDSKNLGDILKHLTEMKEKIEKKAKSYNLNNERPTNSLETPINNPEKPQISRRRSKNNKFPNPIEKMMSMFKGRGNRAESKSHRKSNQSVSGDMKTIAPPQSALSIKELELKDYVKTEKELH